MLKRDEIGRIDGVRKRGAHGPGKDQQYEPPTLTALGSVANLTEVVKAGGDTDPGDGFQPSNL